MAATGCAGAHMPRTAIGVSGAPGGDADEACAKDGMAVIRDDPEL